MKALAKQDQSASALLKTEQVAELFDWHPGTIRAGRSKKTLKLPFIRIGRSIRYRPEDVDAFLEAHREGGEQ